MRRALVLMLALLAVAACPGEAWAEGIGGDDPPTDEPPPEYCVRVREGNVEPGNCL